MLCQSDSARPEIVNLSRLHVRCHIKTCAVRPARRLKGAGVSSEGAHRETDCGELELHLLLPALETTGDAEPTGRLPAMP